MGSEQIFLTWSQLIIFVIVGLLLPAMATWLLIPKLKEMGIVDKPNQRSNHSRIVPRGGGIAVIGIYLSLFTAMCWIGGILPYLWTVVVSAVLLMFVSLVDDIKPLPPLMRLASQFISVILVLSQPHNMLFGGFFPAWLDTFFIAVLWVWFINLYNFMDGIDGITCSQTIVICVAVFLSTFASDFPIEVGLLSLLLAICSISFIFFNWHPARVFLGDVGSVPLGFIVGWLLLVVAMYGYWAAAIILPSYYLLDSGITLIRRLIKREKIWEAHSQHFYQRAVRSGQSHSKVVIKTIFVNVILSAIAIGTAYDPTYSLGGIVAALFVNGFLLYDLNRGKDAS